MVTVYTLPACPQCEMTKKFLIREGIPFEQIDLSEDEAATELVKSWGYQSAPVVRAGNEHWSGFKLDYLKQIKIAA